MTNGAGGDTKLLKNQPLNFMKNLTKILGATAGLLLAVHPQAWADEVTFQVNMSVQTALGNFTVGNGDTVLVAGNWDNWSTTNIMQVTATNANIYSLTLNLTAGSYPNYKFVIDPEGSASSTMNWEIPASFSGGDRWFEVPAGGTILPVVYFSDNTNLPTYQVTITFDVNMAPAIAQNIFTIGSDYVDAFGSFNNWSTTGVLLTNVPGTSNYIGSFVTTALTTNNTLVNYKYAIDGNAGTWEGNVGTNGAQNREFALTNIDQVLPLDYWDNITNLNTSYNVLFEVNMLVEEALGNFTPGSDTVYVNGDWGWSGTALQLTQMGTVGEVYTGAVALVYSPGTTINYKYDIDGGVVASDWENSNVGPGGYQNRQFMLNTATNLPMDYFDNYTNLGPLTLSGNASQTVVAWASGTNANNLIWLQASSSLSGSWTNVAGTQGQSSITNNFGAGPTFFRLVGP
jgi:hypothetical protein